MAKPQVNVMLGRRPASKGAAAFGHIDVSTAGRTGLESIVTQLLGRLKALKEVKFHPDDRADEGEVMTTKLSGFDAFFQAMAPWSLELAVKEARAPGLPSILRAAEISDGRWTFYVIRLKVSASDVVVVRAKSPSYGLSTQGKLITMFSGSELAPVKAPLLAFDSAADLVVVNSKVYVLSPEAVERLFIDADAVKARAPQTAASFNTKLGASLSSKTVAAVERVCSHNANVARRVERLTRDGSLAGVTADKVRAALPHAGLKPADFGTSGPLQAVTDGFATVLVDIAADLYYQPQFEATPRRVAVYRKVT